MPGVLVGVSGGVDSSVATHLLKEEGYDVQGIIFKQVNAEKPEEDGLCCSASAVEEALDVCHELGVRLHIRDLREKFKDRVIDPTLLEMSRGNVPSPCTTCNSSLRVVELDYVSRLLKLDYFSTGHYFQVRDGKVFRGFDRKKDQSYMVALVNRDFFNRWLTPLGHLTKPEVREIADNLDLPTAHNPDSQDLCFKHLLPKFDREMFFDGMMIGSKTCRTPAVGQKKGFGGLRVLQTTEKEILLSNGIVEKKQTPIHSINWIVENPPDEVDVQISSHSMPIKGRVKENNLEIEQAVAFSPGQVAAFYNGEQLLGGAIVSR